MTQKRKIIVHIATSADGYIARPDGNIDWLTSGPAPKGFYGLPEFARSVDAKILGRKTFDHAVKMGAPFNGKDRHYVFSRKASPGPAPPGVEFVREKAGDFARRLRQQAGGAIWLMGGAEIIAAFLDDGAIDEFVITIKPVFIGEGIPLIAPRHRAVPLQLKSTTPFPDGVVQLHYEVA